MFIELRKCENKQHTSLNIPRQQHSWVPSIRGRWMLSMYQTLSVPCWWWQLQYYGAPNTHYSIFIFILSYPPQLHNSKRHSMHRASLTWSLQGVRLQCRSFGAVLRSRATHKANHWIVFQIFFIYIYLVINVIIKAYIKWFKPPPKPYRYKGVRGLDGELYWQAGAACTNRLLCI